MVPFLMACFFMLSRRFIRTDEGLLLARERAAGHRLRYRKNVDSFLLLPGRAYREPIRVGPCGLEVLGDAGRVSRRRNRGSP